jgi:hypothetical protein
VIPKAAQPDVEVLFVPKEEELPTPVGEIGVTNVDWRDKGPIPLIQFAVHFDGLAGLRDQAHDWFWLGSGDPGTENHQDCK